MISKVLAEIEHEQGYDREELYLVKGNRHRGTWRGIWHSHDLKNQKWYNLTIIATDIFGNSASVVLRFQDPVQNHSASEITAGTFDTGDFIFPDQLNVSGNFYVNSTSPALFVDSSSGRVGIGTTGPQSELEVVGELFIRQQSALGSGAGGIRFSDPDTLSEYASIYMDSTNNDLHIGMYGGPWADAMTIKRNGNVGIGTTNPTQLLDVAGSSGPAIAINETSNNKEWRIAVESSKFKIIETGIADRLTIDTSGNVGIGTTDPDQKLKVAGNVNITGKEWLGDDLIMEGNDIIIPSMSSTGNSGDTVIFWDGQLWRYTSSKKFKTNISNLEINTSKIFELQPRSFNPILPNGSISSKRSFGFVAEEVAEIIPELANYNYKEEPISVRYAEFSVLIFQELKKLKTEIAELKEENKELREKIERLEERC